MEDNLLSTSKPKGGSSPKGEKTQAPTNDESLFKPGMSNDELVGALIDMPEEKLIPWELCDLPSGGRFYKDASNNHWPDGFVRVRAMTQTAEKVLATQRLIESGQAIDYLLKECCQFPTGFEPVDLLISDRTFLLYYIRGITHGNDYEFAVDCPNSDCNKKSIHEYDLNQLASTITRPDPSLGDEPFKIVLPYMSKVAGKEIWVHVRFLRGTDVHNLVSKRKLKQRTIVKPGAQQNPFQRRRQQVQESSVIIDQSLTDILSKNIVSVMGVQDPRVISQFVGKMHATDSGTIREWLRDNTPGIDTTVAISCPHCGQEYTVELPISETFFRPAQRKS